MNHKILEKPISDLELTDNTKRIFQELNIKNLSELLAMTPKQITSLPGLSFHMLQEYRKFLADNHLEHLQAS
jgi:Leucine-rich repeat (LRR) protein